MKYHCAKVLAGEYAFPSDPIIRPVTVLDIGANVGSYAIWAVQHIPIKRIHCYEPASMNLAYLYKNVDFAEIYPFAVTSKPGPIRLYYGVHNCGECSIHRMGEQTERYEMVDTIHPSDLPSAEVVKIDTEGCELDIIEHMNLAPVLRLAFEWHSDGDLPRIDAILLSHGLHSVSTIRTRRNRGVAKYAR